MNTRAVARVNPHPRTPRRLWVAAAVAVGGLLVSQGTPALAANRLPVTTAHILDAASASAAPLASGTVQLGPATVLNRQTTPTPTPVFPLPEVGAVFDYQLGGAYPPASGVTVVERDSTERPAAGLYSICYVNAFQTQPGATWPEDLLLHNTSGQRLIDPNWPDENIIDISTPAQQTRAANIIATTIDGCRTSGFNAVEFDNLDSYSRSQGQLTPNEALTYATLLVGRAHQDGIAAAQKNASELAARARQEVGFNFAISEQCAQFNECSSYTTPYNNHVLDVEYTGQLTTTFTALCAETTRAPSTILRDVNLVAAGTSGYHYQHC